MMTRRDFAAALTAGAGLLARASNQIATVVVTLVATRYLAPAEFGVFALASIAITLIRTLLYSGAFEYLLKARDAGDCSSESLAVNLALAVGLGVLLGAIALIAGRLFAADAIALALLAMLPSNLVSAVAAWRESLLLRTGRLRLYYALTTLAELAAMVLAIALLFAGFKVAALIWQLYARNLATLILYMLASPAIYSRRFSRARFVAVLRWSTSRYAAMLVGFGATYSADLFLGIFLSPAATGLFRASSRIVTAVTDMFNQPARTFAMTIFSQRAAAAQRSDTMWPVFFVMAAAVGWAALVGLAAVATAVVPVLLGPQWQAATALVPLLCLARAFSLFDTVASTVLVAYDEQRPLFYIQCTNAAVGVALIALSAPFGLVAVTISTAVSTCLGSTILAVVALRRLPGSQAMLRQTMPALIPPLVATAAGAMAGRAMATGLGLGTAQAAVLAIASGIVAWLLALIAIRHRLLDMILHLRGDPPHPATALAD
ncbi:oligosaccharide flippase family protein [Sphingomonas profundi]|uniref:oligosaccharide flippase family protein n=1 Tax=Alterirhizorhabdus profundi TaxID=2681549 RepID=UPI0012E937FB|nr:oligosaccharide flippase family protein [Sphingomonas profundi]